MTRNPATRELTELLPRFKRRAAEALPGRVAKVVLYGSRARGEGAADSDWDLAVFLDGAPPGAEDRRALADAAYDLIVESGQFIQPLALPLSRWDEESSLLRDIREHGVEI